MTTLNLFPARIRFVNADGTLTPEAFRALRILFDRVGGPLGDNGQDVFGDLTGLAAQDAPAAAADLLVQQRADHQWLADLFAAPDVVASADAQADASPRDVVAAASQAEMLFPDVVQPPSVLPAFASGGAAPAGGVGTAAGGWDTAANRDAAIALINNMRTALIAVGILK